jgi:DNA-binding transcriptional MerR regulator
MELLPIGRFARLTGLSVRALRHYGELGLLEPARVDEETGYRYYVLAQLRDAATVQRLRALDLPLDEIGLVLSQPDLVTERLIAHRARIEGRAAETREILADLERLIEGKEPLVPEKEAIRFELDVRAVPEQRVVGIKERAHERDISTVVPRRIDDVRSHLLERGIEPVGPPLVVCPFPDEDGFIRIATAWPIDTDVEAQGEIEAWTLPATRALRLEHRGPYEYLTGSYRLLEEVIAEHGFVPTGEPREVYVTDPAELADPADYLTEIVWPVGPEGELQPSRDVFKRRVEAQPRR